MQARELERLAAEIGIDAIGAAAAEPYDGTERHIRDRRARGLFADMRFTMAQPEVSCHPEKLVPNARMVVSAALCYYADEPERAPGQGRLSRARRREPARRPRGGRTLGSRLLRQEHLADHATVRLLGRARHSRHRP